MGMLSAFEHRVGRINTVRFRNHRVSHCPAVPRRFHPEETTFSSWMRTTSFGSLLLGEGYAIQSSMSHASHLTTLLGISSHCCRIDLPSQSRLESRFAAHFPAFGWVESLSFPDCQWADSRLVPLFRRLRGCSHPRGRTAWTARDDGG